MKTGKSTNPEDPFKYWAKIPRTYDDGTRLGQDTSDLIKEMNDWLSANIDTGTWFRSHNQFTFQNEQDLTLFALRYMR